MDKLQISLCIYCSFIRMKVSFFIVKPCPFTLKYDGIDDAIKNTIEKYILCKYYALSVQDHKVKYRYGYSIITHRLLQSLLQHQRMLQKELLLPARQSR